MKSTFSNLTFAQLGRLIRNSYLEGYEDCKYGKPPLVHNDPLTPDELREMDGNPVWVEDLASPELSCYWLCYWGRGRHFTLMSKHLIGYLLGDYGKTWLAYRRKPEEGTTC